MDLIQKMIDQEKVLNFLTWGLTNFDLIEIAKSNKAVENVDVWLGKKDTVDVYVKTDIYKTIPKAKKRLLKLSLTISWRQGSRNQKR